VDNKPVTSAGLTQIYTGAAAARFMGVRAFCRVAPKLANDGASLFPQRNLGIHEKPL